MSLLGGLILLGSFMLLAQRRLGGMILLYRAAAFCLSAAAFRQSFLQHSADLFLTGIVTLAVDTTLLPAALRRIMHRLNLSSAVRSTMPVGVSMILGVALTGIAVMVVPPAAASGEDLALALAIMLLGFLVMATRKTALGQAIGFLSAGNGLLLAAISMPQLPFVAAFCIALQVPMALLVLGSFMFRLRDDFEPLDLTGIAEIERRGG